MIAWKKFMISLISSLYRSEQYLGVFTRQLQHFRLDAELLGLEYEHIIILNDPTEGEARVIAALEKNPHIRIVSVPREPLYASWNRGVSLAQGEAVGFWNVDDRRFVSAVAEAETLISQGAALVYFPFKIRWYLSVGNLSLLVKQRTVQKNLPEFSREEFSRAMHCGPFFIFTKRLYMTVGPFDEQFKIAGDFDWCVRAALTVGSFRRGTKIAGIFRVDGRGLSSGYSLRQQTENRVVYKRYSIPSNGIPPSLDLWSEYDPSRIFCSGTSLLISSILK